MLFYAVLIPFTVWLLFDALRRRAALHWFLIVLLLAPFGGGIVYFVFVKLRDYNFSWLPKLDTASQAQSLENLQKVAQEAPSFENRLRLALALEDGAQHAQALLLFRDLVREEPKVLEVNLGLARALVGHGDSRAAFPYFEQVLESDRDFANFSAALEYADALFCADERQDAVELVRALSEHTRRPNHRLAHAHYLIRSGEPERARSELERLISEFEALPKATRSQQQRWEIRARELLAELDLPAEATPKICDS